MKNTYRFFIPPESFRGDAVRVVDADMARQLSRVLRLGPGDRVLLLDGLGDVCEVEIAELSRDLVAGRVLRRDLAGEPALTLTIYLAMIRPERFEWVLQKGTELGVRRFVPVQFARSQAADRADGRKAERWRKIIREAAEQSCRGRLPELGDPISFADACAAALSANIAMILWEGTAPPLRDLLRRPGPPPDSIAILSGPEGGITDDELTAAREHGIMPVSLGSRILRAETAPIAAAAAISYELDR
ncbi:16S rRNA (uracil(1498)-N(3))-methyltransferase [Chloroflexales bacterium ZM16-3]|nr:16S rRNA (uracil(1498)-N(3))-methyltransferase [Chloroflexales bacterium ZM16-3]